jgi:hypothetical protein
MKMRNPLIDPNQGDVVFGRGKTREVISRDGYNIWYIVREQNNMVGRCSWITTWQDWCKKNKAKIINE